MDKDFKDRINSRLDRWSEYADAHPWRIRLAGGAAALAAAGIILGTPVSKVTIEPLQHGIEWVSDQVDSLGNQISEIADGIVDEPVYDPNVYQDTPIQS